MNHLGPSLRRKRRRSRAWPRLAAALLVSLLVNAAMLRFARVGFTFSPPPPQRAVAVSPLSSSQWEANRRVQPGARPPSDPLAVLPAPPPPPPPPQQQPGQVVDVAPSKDSTPPKDSQFVSERNNTVEKETVSRHRKAGYASTQPVPTQPTPGAKAPPQPAVPPSEAGGAKAARGVADGAERRSAPGERPRASDGRLALQLDRFGDQLPLHERRPEGAEAPPKGDPAATGQSGAGQGTGRPGTIDRKALMPSASTYEKLAGGPAPDHVTGVEEGDATYLNTREWKYATYFNRIKQQVASTWDPNRALGARDPEGTRFAYRDRYTVVAVRLDEGGSLKDVEVVKSCGVDFLDDVAMQAFRKAQPFVNPPRGLADGHGEIVFNFGFYLETGGGFRMFRAPSR